MSTLKPIADNVVLRVMTFAHPDGLDILLAAIYSEATDTSASACIIVPAEVYNCDELSIALDRSEENLSELAKGLRYATRQVRDLPLHQALRYQIWLENSGQLAKHIQQQSLQIQTLTVEELGDRDEMQNKHGIGRGEAACIVLAKRYKLQAVFLSSDEKACKVASSLEIDYTTIPEILEKWVTLLHPSLKAFEELIAGMRAAKFALKEIDLTTLRNKFSQS
jgi:predicted nucleic acid-binding protein